MSTPPFHINKWRAGYPETVSGTGSLMINTENVRSNLPAIIKKYQIKSIFDAPCGDRNWIQHVNFPELDCVYSGGEVVEEIVTKINLPVVKKFDLRTDKFPCVDLWFSRDCLYHLSLSDINLVIKNALSSNIKYFLITSHLESESKKATNRDINTGDYRCLILKEHCYFGMGEPIDGFFDCHINLAEEMLLFQNPNHTA
jgi:hypothetical protein